MGAKYSKEDIQKLLLERDDAVKRALVVIYERQTVDEQLSYMSKKLNGKGFSGVDAWFGSAMAKLVIQGKELSKKQLESSRKMVLKYSGQLAQVANERIEKNGN